MNMLFSFRPYLICLCAALFYIYQFVLRVSPSVMVDDIMLSFHLDAASFAFLTASAMYAYSLMQIPAGIFADKYGARVCILASIFFCSLGALGFSFMENYWLALLSRILMGAGSACAFLCLTKVALRWFGVKWQARIFGFTMTAGTIGALNGGAPIAYLLELTSWKGVFVFLSMLGLFIWTINYFFLSEKTADINTDSISTRGMTDIIRTIFKKRNCWINAFVALGIYACVSVIADLWGVAFCMQAFKLSRPEAAQLTSLIYVGLCVGSILIPFLSDSLLERKKFILLGLSVITISLTLFIYGSQGSSLWIVSALLFLTGFFAGTEMLCFTNACESVSPTIAGTVTGFVNCIVMLGGSILQNIVGLVMDYSWQGHLNEQGERLYGQYEYQSGFAVLIACVLGCLVIATLIPIRKTKTLNV